MDRRAAQQELTMKFSDRGVENVGAWITHVRRDG
jgi:hypothetical protein